MSNTVYEQTQLLKRLGIAEGLLRAVVDAPPEVVADTLVTVSDVLRGTVDAIDLLVSLIKSALDRETRSRYN